MKYCNQCGFKVNFRIPPDDNRERHICDNCDTIHYQNPHIITGTLPIHENKVLLCRRAIEPRHGFWTLPAGFMENGESTEQGALRETQEEARANIEIGPLYTLFNLPHINQVYFFYLGKLRDLDFGPGPESLEVKLFKEDEIPWNELAFPVITRTLKHYFDDRRRDHYPMRSELLTKSKL